MRLLLIPLLIALAAVLTAIVLATPPKAGGAVGHATGQQAPKIKSKFTVGLGGTKAFAGMM